MQGPPSTDGYSPAIYSLGGQPPTTNPGGPVMQEATYESFSHPAPSNADAPSNSVPLVSAKAAHDARQVDVVKWLRGGWSMYRENWKYFSGFQLIVFCLDFLLPLTYFIIESSNDSNKFHTLGNGTFASAEYPRHTDDPLEDAHNLSFLSLLTWPLYLGHIFVGLAILRAKIYGVGYNALDDDDERAIYNVEGETDEAKVRFQDFLSAYYLYFPLLAVTFVHGLLVTLGLVLLVLPGLYLMVTLAFVELLYIEYHHAFSTFDRYSDEPQPFSFWQTFTVSVERVHPHFWRIAGFLLILIGISYLGILTVLGSILAIPYTSLCMVVAFEDLFGLRQDKVKEHTCIFSC